MKRKKKIGRLKWFPVFRPIFLWVFKNAYLFTFIILSLSVRESAAAAQEFISHYFFAPLLSMIIAHQPCRKNVPSRYAPIWEVVVVAAWWGMRNDYCYVTQSIAVLSREKKALLPGVLMSQLFGVFVSENIKTIPQHDTPEACLNRGKLISEFLTICLVVTE